jgi:WD40 repeat protein
MSVALEATVLVSTGGKAPITLGAKHAFTSEAILHVWDWSKSDESRILDASFSQSFAVSPDGKWIVSADGQRIEIATGKVDRFPNFGGDVRRVLFSPDGRRLALLVDAGNNTATSRVIEFPGGKQLCEVSNLWPAMLPAAFLPDGSGIFLMGKDNFVRRYDAATGQELQKYEPAHENSVRTMLASPSGKLLCSAGSRGDIYLWEVASGKLLHQLTVEPQVDATIGVYSVAFSPDEAHLAGGGAGNLLLWSVATGKVTKQFPRDSGGAEHIRFSADGKTISTVRGFYGTAGPAGEDLLVYPTKQEWQPTN